MMEFHKGGRPPLWGTPHEGVNAIAELLRACCPAKPGNAGAKK